MGQRAVFDCDRCKAENIAPIKIWATYDHEPETDSIKTQTFYLCPPCAANLIEHLMRGRHTPIDSFRLANSVIRWVKTLEWKVLE